jgi:hypothetical protein
VVNELRRVGAEWGIECTRYEVKDIDPPLEIMSAMKVRRCGRVGGWVRSGAARDASEHITSTSIRHIHPSHPSVTSIRHIHPSHPPVTSTLPSQGGGGGRAEEARGDPRQRGRAAGVHAALCDGGVQPHVLGAATVCVGRCHVQAQINRAEGEKQARVLDSEAERQQMSA